MNYTLRELIVVDPKENLFFSFIILSSQDSIERKLHVFSSLPFSSRPNFPFVCFLFYPELPILFSSHPGFLLFSFLFYQLPILFVMEENPCSETHSSAQLRDEWLEYVLLYDFELSNLTIFWANCVMFHSGFCRI